MSDKIFYRNFVCWLWDVESMAFSFNACAFRYHPLFFLPPVVLVVILLKSKINIKVYKIFMFTIVAAFVIVYMYRMIWGEGDIVVFKPKDSIIWRIIKSL